MDLWILGLREKGDGELGTWILDLKGVGVGELDFCILSMGKEGLENRPLDSGSERGEG